MDRHDAPNDRVIFNSDVSCESAHIGNDDVVSQPIVVGNVAVSQNVVVGADFCYFAVASCAINRDAFAKGVVIADFGSRQATFPFQVLRLQANAGEGEKFVAAADASVSVDDHVWMQSATGAQNNVLTDNTIGPDLAICANFRFGMNNRRLMDH